MEIIPVITMFFITLINLWYVYLLGSYRKMLNNQRDNFMSLYELFEKYKDHNILLRERVDLLEKINKTKMPKFTDNTQTFNSESK